MSPFQYSGTSLSSSPDNVVDAVTTEKNDDDAMMRKLPSTDTTSIDDDDDSSSEGFGALVEYAPSHHRRNNSNYDDLTYHTYTNMSMIPRPTVMDGLLDFVCGAGGPEFDDALDDESTIATYDDTILVRSRSTDTVLTARLESREAREAKIADLLPANAVVTAVVQKKSPTDTLGLTLTVLPNAPMTIDSVSLGSLFDKTGLQPGMHVLSINGANVNGRSIDEVTQPLRDCEGECSITAIKGVAASIHKKSRKTVVGISVRRVKDVVIIDKNGGLFKDTSLQVGHQIYAVNGEIIGRNAELAIQLIRNSVGKVSIIAGKYHRSLRDNKREERPETASSSTDTAGATANQKVQATPMMIPKTVVATLSAAEPVISTVDVQKVVS